MRNRNQGTKIANKFAIRKCKKGAACVVIAAIFASGPVMTANASEVDKSPTENGSTIEESVEIATAAEEVPIDESVEITEAPAEEIVKTEVPVQEEETSVEMGVAPEVVETATEPEIPAEEPIVEPAPEFETPVVEDVIEEPVIENVEVDLTIDNEDTQIEDIDDNTDNSGTLEPVEDVVVPNENDDNIYEIPAEDTPVVETTPEVEFEEPIVEETVEEEVPVEEPVVEIQDTDIDNEETQIEDIDDNSETLEPVEDVVVSDESDDSIYETPAEDTDATPDVAEERVSEADVVNDIKWGDINDYPYTEQPEVPGYTANDEDMFVVTEDSIGYYENLIDYADLNAAQDTYNKLLSDARQGLGLGAVESKSHVTDFAFMKVVDMVMNDYYNVNKHGIEDVNYQEKYFFTDNETRPFTNEFGRHSMSIARTTLDFAGDYVAAMQWMFNASYNNPSVQERMNNENITHTGIGVFRNNDGYTYFAQIMYIDGELVVEVPEPEEPIDNPEEPGEDVDEPIVTPTPEEPGEDVETPVTPTPENPEEPGEDVDEPIVTPTPEVPGEDVETPVTPSPENPEVPVVTPEEPGEDVDEPIVTPTPETPGEDVEVPVTPESPEAPVVTPTPGEENTEESPAVVEPTPENPTGGNEDNGIAPDAPGSEVVTPVNPDVTPLPGESVEDSVIDQPVVTPETPITDETITVPVIESPTVDAPVVVAPESPSENTTPVVVVPVGTPIESINNAVLPVEVTKDAVSNDVMNTSKESVVLQSSNDAIVGAPVNSVNPIDGMGQGNITVLPSETVSEPAQAESVIESVDVASAPESASNPAEAVAQESLPDTGIAMSNTSLLFGGLFALLGAVGIAASRRNKDAESK